MRPDTIARVERAHELIKAGVAKSRAFAKANTTEVTYNQWLRENAPPAPTQASAASADAGISGETVTGRLLRSNLPDADKLEILRASFR